MIQTIDNERAIFNFVQRYVTAHDLQYGEVNLTFKVKEGKIVHQEIVTRESQNLTT